MSSYWKLHRTPILIVLGSLLFYVDFAYDLNREDFLKLLGLFAGLFFFCVKMIQFEKWNFKFLLVAGILFRLAFLFAEPNLSQDFYRFIWDGKLLNMGINPYLYSPNDLMKDPQFALANAEVLHEGMGELSAKHFSNYPPFNQVLFALAAFFGGGSIMGSLIAFRLMIIFSDIGVLLIGRKLLQHLGISNHMAFWYFLNPLVVIELTGNLHFEGVMLFFFVSALYLVIKRKWLWAAPVYAASIMVKLVPILFLPLFLKYFGFKKSIAFYLMIGIACLVFVLPFYSPVFVENYTQTVGLWFSNFEFNAGIYNLVKEIGVTYFDAKPWELVKSYGSLVPKLVVLAALLLTFLRNNKNFGTLIGSMLILLSFYYFLSSTVHPWYVIFPLLLTLFTQFRFALVWSAMVILSYYAYSNPDFKENLWLLAIEYFVVFGYLGYEILKKHNIKSMFRKKQHQK